MKTFVIVIVMVLACTSPFGLFHLVWNYGSDWKFKDLRPFGKFVNIYLWSVIVIWSGLITYLIVTSIK